MRLSSKLGLVFAVATICTACSGGSGNGASRTTASDGKTISTINQNNGQASESASSDTTADTTTTLLSGAISSGNVTAASPDGYRANFHYEVSLSDPRLDIKNAPPSFVLLSSTASGKVEVSNETDGGRTLHFDWSGMSGVGVGYLPAQYGATAGSADTCELMRGIYCFIGSLGYPSNEGVTDIESGYVATASLGEIRVVSDDPSANSTKLLENEGKAIFRLIQKNVPPIIDVDLPDDWTVEKCDSKSGIIVTTSTEYSMPQVGCTDGIPGA